MWGAWLNVRFRQNRHDDDADADDDVRRRSQGQWHCEGPGAPGDPAVVAAMAIAGARGALARLEEAVSPSWLPVPFF